MTTPERPDRSGEGYTPSPEELLNEILEPDDEKRHRTPPAGLQAARAEIITLANVAPQSVEWFWRRRIAYGKITILEGQPGVGKSHLTIEFAAIASTGRNLPDTGTPAACDVVLVTCEDGLADTVRPRLDAAGGDPNRVHVLAGVRVNGEESRLPTIPDDMPLIRHVLEETGARLLIIDPLMAYLGDAVNSHRDHAIRRALAPLQHLAEESNVAVVIVRHLKKGATGDAIEAGGGSIGFAGLARSVLLVARDPEDERRVVLAVTKCNIAEKAPSLIYSLEQTGNDTARVRWEGISRHTADSLLAAAHEEDRQVMAEAAEWLKEYLGDGPVPAQEAKRAAREAGFSERTVERARAKLRVTSERDGFGKGAKYVWELPSTHACAAHASKTRHAGEHGNGSGPKSFVDKASASSPPLASMGDDHDA